MTPLLFHSPLSRSTTIRMALAEMGVEGRVALRRVTIRRRDGSGGPDPANPHPEGKVPVLMLGNRMVWERAAILIQLSELFPDAPAICPPGDADRGTFLSWLVWYGSVVEPVLLLQLSGLSDPRIITSLRGPAEMADRIEAALADGRDYLLGRLTLADLLLTSPFQWLPDATPDRPAVRDWVARVAARPHVVRIAAEEAAG